MDLAKHWRLRSARYRLEGQRHTTSGEVRFPPQPAAPGQNAADWQPHQLSGKGTLYSFSVVRQPPAGFEGEPWYLVGLVQLEEGPLITAQITDCDASDLAIGMPLEAVTRRLRDLGEQGLIVYGYKFRPVLIAE